jgi:alanine racemase
MHRVGASPAAAVELAARIRNSGRLRLAGVFTHLAVADEPARLETAEQLRVFDAVLARIGPVEVVHAANSAGALAHPASRRSFVRAGIAVYGVAPGPDLRQMASNLRPALSLRARVSFVKRLHAGDRLSYGLRHTLRRDANVATLPLGYADGVRRNLSGLGIPVLLAGCRRPIVGTITMDQLLVDCGDADVAVGDEAVLLGEQGGDRIMVEEWASALGTIGYEITCGISGRVPRRHHGAAVGAFPASDASAAS